MWYLRDYDEIFFYFVGLCAPYEYVKKIGFSVELSVRLVGISKPRIDSTYIRWNKVWPHRSKVIDVTCFTKRVLFEEKIKANGFLVNLIRRVRFFILDTRTLWKLQLDVGWFELFSFVLLIYDSYYSVVCGVIR